MVKKQIAGVLFLLSITPCFATLATEDPNAAIIRIESMVQKKKASAAAVQDLTDALRDPVANIRVKERAAWALGELDAKSAAPALQEAAKHKGLLVRSAALNALSRLRVASALPTFVSIAESDPILSLRQNATLALGLLQTEKAINPLVKLSEDPAPEIQGASALAMAATHSKKNDFSEILKEMTASPNEYVQERARAGLDAAQQKNTAVLQQLASGDADIRLFAALYFRQHGTSKELQKLNDFWNGEADEETRRQLEMSIKAIKKRAAQAKQKTKPATVPAKKPVK